MTTAVRLATVLLVLTCCLAAYALQLQLKMADLSPIMPAALAQDSDNDRDNGDDRSAATASASASEQQYDEDDASEQQYSDDTGSTLGAGRGAGNTTTIETGGPRLETFPTLDDGSCPAPLVKRQGACFPR